MSKYKNYGGHPDSFDKLDVGWYLWEDINVYHFGGGYVAINWGGSIDFGHNNRCNISKEELRKLIEITKTPLYKAVYGTEDK